MIAFFDLDGVVIDSERAIIDAYKAAGVVAPKNILSLEGNGWLERMPGGAQRAVIVRQLKDYAYVDAISHGEAPLLSGWYAAVKLTQLGCHVSLLTGAPHGAIDSLRKWTAEWVANYGPYPMSWPFDIAIGKLTQQRKIELLLGLREPSTYVDDQPVLRWPIRNGWIFANGVPHIHVVRYTGQDDDALVNEVMSE